MKIIGQVGKGIFEIVCGVYYLRSKIQSLYGNIPDYFAFVGHKT